MEERRSAEGSLVRSRLLLDLAEVDDDVVVFVQDESVTELVLDRSRWLAMAEPVVLTVTVEPGDLLNPPLPVVAGEG